MNFLFQHCWWNWNKENTNQKSLLRSNLDDILESVGDFFSPFFRKTLLAMGHYNRGGRGLMG